MRHVVFAKDEKRKVGGKFVTPIYMRQLAPVERMYFLLKIVSADKLSKFIAQLFRRARACCSRLGPAARVSEEATYFVPSLHKSLTLSWKRRPSDDDVASGSPRGQLNPRILVVECLDPLLSPPKRYSESREAYHPNLRFAISNFCPRENEAIKATSKTTYKVVC